LSNLPNSNSKIQIHPLSDVRSTQIGDGTVIWQFSVVLEGAKIGENCNINALTLIEGGVVVGDNVTVKSGVQLWDGLHVGNNAFIGPNVTFTNDLIPRSKQRPAEYLITEVKHNASIGANATIIGGITIGSYSLIGAGSVVTKDVPAYGLVYGNPATLQGYICECGSKLNNLSCSSCAAKYSINENVVFRQRNQ